MFVRRVPSLVTGRFASLNKQFARDASNIPLGAVTKIVDPFSSIKISSKYHVNIKPYNIHECPDGNLLRISFRSFIKDENVKLVNEVEEFAAAIDVDGANVSVDINSLSTAHLDAVECLIEVPVAANLNVHGQRNVSVENSLCDVIDVSSADGNIRTKSVRSKSLDLNAQNGNIECIGMTLAQEINIRTNGNKNIRLEKIQGVILNAISENGRISTEACYAENSKFVTSTGKLRLKNLHMNSNICLLNGGELHLTGFYGTLNVTANDSVLNLQLAEIVGASRIDANAPKSLTINISDLVEENTFIEANVGEVVLDETLNHLNEKIANKGKLVIGDPEHATNASLTINSNGTLALGKLSWIDSFSIKLQ